jgi:phage-related holin
MQFNVLAFLKSAAWSVGTMLLDLFIGVKPFVLFTIFITLIDMYTGTRAATFRGETLNSKGFRRTVTKLLLYMCAILMSRAFEVVFLDGTDFSFNLVWIVSGIIALSEMKSNFENIGTVTGIDFWSVIANKMPSLKDWTQATKPTDEPKSEPKNELPE